jgi:hypothetical protein
MSQLLEHTPPPVIHHERIGDREFQLPEIRLNVSNDVTLWPQNPRLFPYTVGGNLATEEDLEEALRRTNGYEGLRKSILDMGQMEPIYVWKRPEYNKYLVLEGATRVTCLRELMLGSKDEHRAERFRYVRAKVLPENFDDKYRAILLARIHVRGDAVRNWGRYIEAKFVYDHVVSKNGNAPVMIATDFAGWLGKSLSWVVRLRDAYQFAEKFVEYLDSDDGPKLALDYFSVLEEISKAPGFGPRVKADNSEGEALRTEVFDMVAADVFQEYRDARFMQQFFTDPEKWARLKSHEKGVAHRLATEVKAGNSSARAKIQGLFGQMERTLDREPDALNDDDLEELQKSVGLLASRLAGGIGVLRLRLREFVKALEEAPLKDVRAVTQEEVDTLLAGIEDFQSRWEKARQRDGVAALKLV